MSPIVSRLLSNTAKKIVDRYQAEVQLTDAEAINCPSASLKIDDVWLITLTMTTIVILIK